MNGTAISKRKSVETASRIRVQVGKRDGAALRRFLETRHDRMPRTMLRYAIERFPEAERQKYLRVRR